MTDYLFSYLDHYARMCKLISIIHLIKVCLSAERKWYSIERVKNMNTVVLLNSNGVPQRKCT